ncbi:YgdI/YgdR family lipoprotein [Castellaniella sp.]|uniref:YgdI/YgdR family lipoprotein n=1 Tax=Castellaniella sp. TaxID=1955812 RepID=UPI002AFE3567|nr:YgdI/YgdR family lipoprotein [Castellaniella sp.]
MSKKIPGLLAVLAGSFVMAACSTPSTVTTNDGKTDYTADAPQTDTDDGFVRYEKDGHEVKVNKSDVKRIEEVN